MSPRPARPLAPPYNPAYVQCGRPACVTVEEEPPLAFVYHYEQLRLEPQRKYLCIISDRRSHQGWDFNAVVKPAEAQTEGAVTPACGDKERRVSVKMTSSGLLGHGCPPYCCCWDIGSLSSSAPPHPVLFLQHQSGHLPRSWARLTSITHTLTASTCSQMLDLQ